MADCTIGIEIMSRAQQAFAAAAATTTSAFSIWDMCWDKKVSDIFAMLPPRKLCNWRVCCCCCCCSVAVAQLYTHASKNNRKFVWDMANRQSQSHMHAQCAHKWVWCLGLLFLFFLFYRLSHSVCKLCDVLRRCDRENHPSLAKVNSFFPSSLNYHYRWQNVK